MGNHLVIKPRVVFGTAITSIGGLPASSYEIAEVAFVYLVMMDHDRVPETLAMLVYLESG